MRLKVDHPARFASHLATSLCLLIIMAFACSSAPLFAQGRHQATANLRLSVNVTPVVFPVLADSQSLARSIHAVTSTSPNGLLEFASSQQPLTILDEVRRLSETGWANGRAFGAGFRQVETASWSSGLEPSRAWSAPASFSSSDPVVRTRIVVPR